jgi:hypothetical protein
LGGEHGADRRRRPAAGLVAVQEPCACRFAVWDSLRGPTPGLTGRVGEGDLSRTYSTDWLPVVGHFTGLGGCVCEACHPTELLSEREGVVVRVPRVVMAVLHLVDRFEGRGIYVPGEDNKSISPWRDFGWLFAGFLIAVAVFVLLFAFAT